MANVYSYALIQSHAGQYRQFICPIGYRAVIRNVVVFNSDAVFQAVGHLILWPDDCTIFQWKLAPAEAVEGAQFVNQLLHLVFDYGQYIETRNDSTIDMVVSGYLLTLP